MKNGSVIDEIVSHYYYCIQMKELDISSTTIKDTIFGGEKEYQKEHDCVRWWGRELCHTIHWDDC